MSTSSTKTQPRWRKHLARLRLLLLLSVVAGAFMLLTWSRNHDPRFYWFIQSPPGQSLARLFDWHTGLRPRTPEKDLSAWTRAEREAHASLVQRLDAIQPDTRVHLTSGRILEGRLIQEDANELVLEVKADVSFGASITLSRSRVERMVSLDPTPPPVSRRDVQFHLEFPDYGFYRRPPFTVITDRGAFEAADAVDMLRDLHDTLRDTFASLLDDDQTDDPVDGIQLLFFSKEESYQAYVDRLAAHLEFSSGFYSPWQDRLVWYDQAGSHESQALREHIAAREAADRQRARHPEHLRRVEQAAHQARRQLNRAADTESRRVLRHEGAHQLLFTLGIHSRYYAEHAWLLEGLAQYFEENPPGYVPHAHRAHLNGPLLAGDPLPVERLLALRAVEGLHILEDPELISVAYFRSAALVRWLMQPDRQPSFLSWLAELRDPAKVWRAATTDHATWLAEHLGLSREDLLEQMRTEAFGPAGRG